MFYDISHVVFRQICFLLILFILLEHIIFYIHYIVEKSDYYMTTYIICTLFSFKEY